MGLCIDLNFDQLPYRHHGHVMEEELFLFSPEFETQRINFLDEEIHMLLNALVLDDASQNNLFYEESLNTLMMQVYQLEKSLCTKWN